MTRLRHDIDFLTTVALLASVVVTAVTGVIADLWDLNDFWYHTVAGYAMGVFAAAHVWLNRERLIGSRAYITALAQGNGYGLVSTHDLELADMEKRVPALSNAHFQETVNAGALEFDYQLRPGPCPTTNALRIMELEGLPIADAGANPHLDS